MPEKIHLFGIYFSTPPSFLCVGGFNGLVLLSNCESFDFDLSLGLKGLRATLPHTSFVSQASRLVCINKDANIQRRALLCINERIGNLVKNVGRVVNHSILTLANRRSHDGALVLSETKSRPEHPMNDVHCIECL